VIAVRAAQADQREAWDAFVARRPEGDVLQSWAWGEAMATVGEPPVRLVARDPSGVLAGAAQVLVRPTFLGRTVLYVPHGPLWDRGAAQGDAVLAAMLGALAETARAQRAIVLKVDPRAVPGASGDDETGHRPVTGGHDGARIAALLHRSGLRRARLDLQATTTRLVDLTGGDAALENRWRPAARNQVRRAAKEGVRVEVLREAEPTSLDALHALLVATAGGGRFRVRPRSFLERLAAGLAPTGGWYLALARLAGRAIAAAVGARTGERAFYLYGAALRDPALRHAFGSYAAMAGLIGALGADGVRTLDLWGVAEPDDPAADPSWAGFSHFKRLFGGVPLRHPGTFDLVIDPLLFRVRDLRERLVAGRAGGGPP
jgi:lipid II:glycine glycyltransferase (peptidoglycan interpeptide bridge formation enzyme)